MKPKIDLFKNENEWLSNFWLVDVLYEEIRYPSSEHAYQAAKTLDSVQRRWIRDCPTPGNAKKNGRNPKRITLRPDWESVKLKVMYDINRIKFSHYDLKTKLLETGDAELIEGNLWHDNYWGNCTCDACWPIEGENQLGKILMKVREDIRGQNKEQEEHNYIWNNNE